MRASRTASPPGGPDTPCSLRPTQARATPLTNSAAVDDQQQPSRRSSRYGGPSSRSQLPRVVARSGSPWWPPPGRPGRQQEHAEEDAARHQRAYRDERDPLGGEQHRGGLGRRRRGQRLPPPPVPRGRTRGGARRHSPSLATRRRIIGAGAGLRTMRLIAGSRAGTRIACHAGARSEGGANRDSRACSRGLGEEGHPTDVADTGGNAVWMARAKPYDAIMLDVMLPSRTRSRVAASFTRRTSGRRCSSSARATTASKTGRRPRRRRRRLPRQAVLVPQGLSPGAPPVLTRRGPVERPTVLEVGSLRLDPAGRTRLAGRHRDRAVGEGVHAARRGLHAAPGQVLSSSSCSSGGGTWPVRDTLQHRRRVHALPPREDRPPVELRLTSRPCARRRVPVARARRVLRAIPIRWRLAAAFAVSMAVLLVALGAFRSTSGLGCAPNLGRPGAARTGGDRGPCRRGLAPRRRRTRVG